MKFSLVPYGMLTSVLPLLAEYLPKSELWTKGRASIDDIVGFLYSGRMQLWAVHEDGVSKIHGYIVTEIKAYPKMNALVLQYSAGEKHIMDSIENMVYATLENYARDSGCKVIEAFGRPGWGPNMKKHGYTVETVVYERYL